MLFVWRICVMSDLRVSDTCSRALIAAELWVGIPAGRSRLPIYSTYRRLTRRRARLTVRTPSPRQTHTRGPTRTQRGTGAGAGLGDLSRPSTSHYWPHLQLVDSGCMTGCSTITDKQTDGRTDAAVAAGGGAARPAWPTFRAALRRRARPLLHIGGPE